MIELELGSQSPLPIGGVGESVVLGEGDRACFVHDGHRWWIVALRQDLEVDGRPLPIAQVEQGQQLQIGDASLTIIGLAPPREHKPQLEVPITGALHQRLVLLERNRPQPLSWAQRWWDRLRSHDWPQPKPRTQAAGELFEAFVEQLDDQPRPLPGAQLELLDTLLRVHFGKDERQQRWGGAWDFGPQLQEDRAAPLAQATLQLASRAIPAGEIEALAAAMRELHGLQLDLEELLAAARWWLASAVQLLDGTTNPQEAQAAAALKGGELPLRRARALAQAVHDLPLLRRLSLLADLESGAYRARDDLRETLRNGDIARARAATARSLLPYAEAIIEAEDSLQAAALHEEIVQRLLDVLLLATLTTLRQAAEQPEALQQLAQGLQTLDNLDRDWAEQEQQRQRQFRQQTGAGVESDAQALKILEQAEQRARQVALRRQMERIDAAYYKGARKLLEGAADAVDPLLDRFEAELEIFQELKLKLAEANRTTLRQIRENPPEIDTEAELERVRQAIRDEDGELEETSTEEEE